MITVVVVGGMTIDVVVGVGADVVDEVEIVEEVEVELEVVELEVDDEVELEVDVDVDVEVDVDVVVGPPSPACCGTKKVCPATRIRPSRAGPPFRATT